MAKLTIITQNLKGSNDYVFNGQKQGIDLFILENIKEKYKSACKDIQDINIYAFQELRKVYRATNKPNDITETFVADESLKDGMRVYSRPEEIWEEAFPWIDFRTYLDERDIIFAGKKIKIINFHSAPTYDYGPRYTLLKRLSEIPKNELIILLGDFNAGFLYQTEGKGTRIIEGANFLKVITEYGFIECTASEECDDGVCREPHHTYYDNKNGLCKWDHIFISKSLLKLLRKYDEKNPYEITYIDEVNRDKHPESATAFTDHSGIKLTIELPDA